MSGHMSNMARHVHCIANKHTFISMSQARVERNSCLQIISIQFIFGWRKKSWHKSMTLGDHFRLFTAIAYRETLLSSFSLRVRNISRGKIAQLSTQRRNDGEKLFWPPSSNEKGTDSGTPNSDWLGRLN